VNGKRFISSKTCDLVFDEQARGTDMVLGVPMVFGMGYGLNSEHTPLSANPNACFWGGWGGSLCVNDLDANLTYTYVMNRMGNGTVGDVRGAMPLMAAFGCLS